MNENSGVNGGILYGIYLLEAFTNLVFKINIWVHQMEFNQLFQDVMQVNANWGEILFRSNLITAKQTLIYWIIKLQVQNI